MPRPAIQRLNSLPRKIAAFVEPMECALVTQLRDGPHWLYEIKLDGYCAVGVKSGGRITLFSRRGKSFNEQFPNIAEALSDLPDGTIVDGEVVALDSSGRPDFHLLQRFRSQAASIHYFVFDLLCCKSRDLTRLPLIERRELMRSLLTYLISRCCCADSRLSLPSRTSIPTIGP